MAWARQQLDEGKEKCFSYSDLDGCVLQLSMRGAGGAKSVKKAVIRKDFKLMSIKEKANNHMECEKSNPVCVDLLCKQMHAYSTQVESPTGLLSWLARPECSSDDIKGIISGIDLRACTSDAKIERLTACVFGQSFDEVDKLKDYSIALMKAAQQAPDII